MFDPDKCKEYARIRINEDYYYNEDEQDRCLNTLLDKLTKIKNDHPNEELVFWYDRDVIYYPGDPFDSYLIIGSKC